MKTHLETLDNGLRLLVAPLPHLHTVAVSVFVRAGSRYETRETNGLSHLLEHMLFRGTATYPNSYALNHAIEELGGDLDAATHVDFTSYELSLPPESFAEGTRRVAEIFRAPIFEGLDVEKQVLKEEILEDLDEDGKEIDVDNISRSLLFGEDPLGFTIPGSIENVLSFDERSLRAHMSRHYGASNMVVCVAGAVDAAAALDAAYGGFGSLSAGERTRCPETSSGPLPGRFRYVHDAGSQTRLRLSFHTFGLQHHDMMALQLLGRVLDDGMSTRMHRRICDETGLCYDAFADVDPYEERGVFDLGGSVEHEKTPALVEELLGLVDSLRDEPISKDEFEKARRRYLWDLQGALDDDTGIASFYGTNLLFDLPDTLESAAAEARALDVEDLRRVARTILEPSRAHLSCVGVLDDGLEERVRAALAR